MNTSRILAAALAALLVLPTARAQLVHDIQNTLQTIKVVEANITQIAKLGQILGVNTEQLATLSKISSTIGDASNVAQFGKSMSLSQLSGYLNKIPGLEGTDVGKIFNTNGALDIFGGYSINQWKDMVENPTSFYRSQIMSSALRKVGESAGMNSREIAMLDYVRLNAGGGHMNKWEVSKQVADIMMDRHLEAEKERKQRLQALSATTQASKESADNAKTLTEQTAAQTAVLNNAAQAIIEGSNQAGQHATAQTTAIEKGNASLAEQIERDQMATTANKVSRSIRR